MCNSNAPTSMIEQGIVVRCHSGSFISNGLEKKTTNHARSSNSSVALKPSVCEKEIFFCATRNFSRRSKKDLTRKTCKRPSSLEEDSFSSTGFVDCLASSGLCWFPLVSIYGLFLRADVSTACPAPVGFNLRFVSPSRGTLLISIIRLPANAGSSWWPAACRRL